MVSIAITAAGLAVISARADAAPRALTGTARLIWLISQMSLTEKVNMIDGAAEAAATNKYQTGYLPGVPRLGIPSLRLADGPPGVATKQASVGMTQTMGVAATFSTRDARDNGVVTGRDARALGQDVALQPFVNMDRDPTWARAFNVFGEDPYLTGQTGAAEITGIQSQRTLAQVKHFIAYDGANTVVVDEQTLHETYLAPFTDAVSAGRAHRGRVRLEPGHPHRPAAGRPGPADLRLAAVNPRTVVVLNTHLPVAMPWLGRVSAVLQMWFPGDTGGVATAKALVGRVNPAGRLPFTWPTTIEQTVAHDPAHPERTSLGVHRTAPRASPRPPSASPPTA
jgi:hypothetical protein